MKVGFDARMVSHPGIGRYIRSLLEAMLSAESNLQITLIGESQCLEDFKKNPHAEIRECRVPIYSLQEQWGMSRFLQGFDLVHIPHFNTPLDFKGRYVVTIHDLIYFHVKDYLPFPGAGKLLEWKLGDIARNAKKIISVSHSTAEDLRQLIPRADKKIEVIHEAPHKKFMTNGHKPLVNLKSEFNISKPYILYVGSLREHKNVQGLLKAYENLRKAGRIHVDLVLAGKLDPRFEKKYAFRAQTHSGSGIHHLDNVQDEDLCSLYREAQCLVLPSFYEGFGLPAVEAMVSGLAVVSSDSSSLPEVLGDAGLLFDPARIDGLEERLYNVLSNNELRQNLIKKGRERAALFSWQKAAKQTLKVYQEALS